MYFRLYVPRSYTKTKKYPLVVTLHGVGEKGSDNRMQVDNENITHQWMLDSVQKKYAPFILCPQCWVFGNSLRIIPKHDQSN